MSSHHQTHDDTQQPNEIEQELRIHQSQQEAIVEISRRALYSATLNQFVQETIDLVTKALQTDYWEVLQLLPDENKLLLRAGAGWRPGYIGHTRLDMGVGSQAGFTLQVGKPVIVADLLNDTRFSAPSLLVEHNVVSGMTVIIPGKEGPYGVLGVHTKTRRIFSSYDANFLQTIANFFALVINRQEVETSLRTSRDQLSVILDGVAEGITVQGSEGQLIYVNEVAASLLGYSSPEELIAAQSDIARNKYELFDEQGAVFPMERLPGRRALRGERNVSEVVRFRSTVTGEEGWWIIRAAPVLNALKEVEFAVNIFHPITELKHSEQDQRFLAEASDMLASSLDYPAVLSHIADMAVKNVADWCAIHLIEKEGEVQQLAVAHKDPAKIALTQELQERYPPDPQSQTGVRQVLRTGQAEFYPEIPDEGISMMARDAEHLEMLRSLGLYSAMVLPLIAHGHTLGAITLVWAESRKRYGEREIVLGEELARRAALAIDNIRLYQEANSLNTELEVKVARRTAQLERTISRLNTEIDERKKAEKDLQKSRALFSDLFDLSPDAIFLVDQAGKIMRVNAQGEAIFGYDRSELIGKYIDQLLPERFSLRHATHRNAYHDALQRRSMGADLELYGRRKSGEEFPVDVVLNPVKIEDEWLVISSVRDITEQKRIQAELTEVQHRLIDSQEAERLMLAQELHDGTIQDIFSINFLLAEIENKLSQAGDAETSKELRDASEMTQQVIQDLRISAETYARQHWPPLGLNKPFRAIWNVFKRCTPAFPFIQT